MYKESAPLSMTTKDKNAFTILGTSQLQTSLLAQRMLAVQKVIKNKDGIISGYIMLLMWGDRKSVV